MKPGDIDIVAAMGDSLTAGNGAFALDEPHLTVENRGVSAAIGTYYFFNKRFKLNNYNNKRNQLSERVKNPVNIRHEIEGFIAILHQTQKKILSAALSIYQYFLCPVVIIIPIIGSSSPLSNGRRT